MNKKYIIIVAAIAIAAIVLISTVFLTLNMTPNDKTAEEIDKTAQEVIITPADFNSSLPSNVAHGPWKSTNFSAEAMYYYILPEMNDSFGTSLTTNYSNSYTPGDNTSIGVMVWHFNSNCTATTIYKLIRQGAISPYLFEVYNQQNIYLGDAGFAVLYEWANVTDNGTGINWLMFIKGEYLVYMSFPGWAGTPPNWLISEIMEIAQIQANKIPS